jgi:hypothetical protein
MQMYGCMGTYLEHATFATTLTAQDAYLGKVYLSCRRANCSEDVLKFVDNRNNLQTESCHLRCPVPASSSDAHVIKRVVELFKFT